ncbi:hypothetical protein CYMTET_15573, partial [Cymbomonas tetramitiformis]
VVGLAAYMPFGAIVTAIAGSGWRVVGIRGAGEGIVIGDAVSVGGGEDAVELIADGGQAVRFRDEVGGGGRGGEVGGGGGVEEVEWLAGYGFTEEVKKQRAEVVGGESSWGWGPQGHPLPSEMELVQYFESVVMRRAMLWVLGEA